MLIEIFAKISGKVPEELKVIWRQIDNKRLFYFGTAAAFVSSGISAVVPYIYGRLTDSAVSGAFHTKTILFFLALWLLLSLFRDFMTRLVDKTGSFLAMDAQNNFHVKMLSHLIDLPLAFHKEKKSGMVMSKINRGADGIFNLLDSAAFGFLPNFISFFIALFIILVSEWRLAAIIATMICFYAIVTLKYTRIIISEDKNRHGLWDKVYGGAHDTVANIAAVKSFTNENFERKKTKSNLIHAAGAFKEMMKIWRRLWAWQQTIFGAGFVVIFGAALLLLSRGEMSVGKFVMFIGYFSLITNPVVNLANQYRFIRRSVLAISRAVKLLNYKPEADYPFSQDIGKIQGKVVFQNVFFKYKKGGEILKDVSFSVEPGEMAALVGESGVGKSTLVSLISRYYLPVQGKIFIDGKEIRRVKFRSLREQIAVVPQEVALFNDTVRNNIAYGKIKASDEEIIAAAKAANADEFIEKFPKKYRQIVGERGIKLSTGQKQRIAIARAILRDPRILILDEATAALDSVSEKLVQDALRNLIKGRTVFVIAHRLSTITSADKIIVLEGGKIVETGRHEDLIKQEGVYKKFWELQTRIETEKPEKLLNGMIE